MELTILRNEIMKDRHEIKPEIESQLKDMANQVDEAVGLMRRIVSDLRPGILDQLGLEDAIKVHSSEAEKRSGITFRVESSIKSLLKIKSEQAIIIFRIFQEIISNIIRHSGAKTGSISLQANKNIFILEVVDDGRGIRDAELKRTDSFGIMGMKERTLLVDGKLQITGEINRGTKVLLEVPVK
jgi:signal transduction histidine kinase